MRLHRSPAGAETASLPPEAAPVGLFRGREWWGGAVLVLLTFLVYLPIWRAGFIWDDDSFLTENRLIQRADGLLRFWLSTDPPDYFPLTSTTLWFEWRLWGMNALGYHLVNVLLHALSTVFWWRVLRRLQLPGAWLIAAIFAVHPVNVESVAWITERKNTLAMFFYALTFLAWLRFEDAGGRKWYWVAWVSFWLSLLSKTAVVPLPVVLLALAWWRRGRIAALDVKRVLPFFVLAAAMALVTMWYQAHRAIGEDVVRTDGFAARLAGAGWGFWFYLYKLLWPAELIFVYPRWTIDAGNSLAYVPLVLFVLLLLVCWFQRERWGRGWLFGLAYFVLLLMPIIGFVNIYFMKYSLVADHWQYFAMLGPIALVGVTVTRMLARRGSALPLVGGMILLALGVLTWRQCLPYRANELLWRDILAKDPNSPMAHNSYGALLLDRAYPDSSLPQLKDGPGATAVVKPPAVQQDLVDQAIGHFLKALAVNTNDAVAHNNYGNALFVQGDLDGALAHVLQSAKIDPKVERTHIGWGNILLKKGQVAEATAQYREAVRLNPYMAEAYFTLGNALFVQRQFDEAIRVLRTALLLRPRLDQARELLGQTLQQRGMLDAALTEFQEVLRVRPNSASAHNNFGTILLQSGSPESAIDHFRIALRLEPDMAVAHYNLGNALNQVGQSPEALVHLRRAVELQPDNASAVNNLGGTLLQLGQAEEAVEIYERALQLRPDHAVTQNNLGRALLQQRQPGAAAARFQKALELQPDFTWAADNLRQAVWLLATSPDNNVRDGSKAVDLAQWLGRHTATNTPLYLGTLAAAYAEARRFPDAISSATRGRDLAMASTNAALARDLEAQLALYRSGISLQESDRRNANSPR